jgi:hypothetical protein
MSDHPVTRDDDAHGIPSICCSNGSGVVGPSQPIRDLTIGPGLASGNIQESIPDFFLKKGSPHIERNRKNSALTREVFSELLFG